MAPSLSLKIPLVNSVSAGIGAGYFAEWNYQDRSYRVEEDIWESTYEFDYENSTEVHGIEGKFWLQY